MAIMTHYDKVPGLDPTAEQRAQAAARIQFQQQAANIAQQAQARGLSGARQAQALAPAAIQQQTDVGLKQLQQQQQQLEAQTQLELQQEQTAAKARMFQREQQQQAQLAEQARDQYLQLANMQQETKRRITADDIRAEKALQQQGLIYDQSLFFLTDQQQRDLDALDRTLSKEIFDARMVFAGSEQQREFTNQMQLLDFAITEAKSQEQLRDYAQFMQQENAKREMLMQAFMNNTKAILERGYLKEKGDLDYQHKRQLMDMYHRIKLDEARRQARDKRRAAWIGTAIKVGTVAAMIFCLPRYVNILTSHGAIPIHRLRPGIRVYTRNEKGHKVLAPIIRIQQILTPADHKVIQLTLADGRSVAASPLHPDATGKLFKSFKVGDKLDGSEITKISELAYGNTQTYDILVDSPMSTYWANDVELRSTIIP